MTEGEARAFIATAHWRYAWTYRKWAEHWYTRREDASDRDGWQAFAQFVHTQSRPMHWKGPSSMVFNYTDLDGWMYWCAENEEVLVNKARIRSPDVRLPARSSAG
jgi:hypothetical protein